MAIVKKQAGAKANRASITAATKINASTRRRNVAMPVSNLNNAQQAFETQLRRNMKASSSSVMAATNTANIMARPDFLELLPLFVQKLYITDVFGSVAMRSRQQLIPYFKFISETTKGETAAGTVMSSPFVNRQGVDPNFTGRVVKNEVMAEGNDIKQSATLVYTPVLPGSVTVQTIISGAVTPYTDGADGQIYNAEGEKKGTIDYATGVVTFDEAPTAGSGNVVRATYQYDNETVGPDETGHYGAKMAKGYLQLDEINLKAEAMELACYWSIYSAFVTQQEYGSNLGDIAKEAAVAELTAEINSKGFALLADAAKFNPKFNWDASPVLTGAVVPSDYLNMFKLKLNQAAAAIYQTTRLARPNRLVVGTNVHSYMAMVDGWVADSSTENVGPFHAGTLGEFEVYCDPNYDPDMWVMSCKSDDIRRNSALFGEYMPIVDTQAIGLANASVQQGYATMNSFEIVNPATIVSGKITGTY